MDSSIGNGSTGNAPTDALVFFVNGRKVCVEKPDPAVTLLQYLRSNLELYGAKSSCQEGGCGSCTVMISKYCHYTKKISHYTVVACITSICAVHGLAVTTVEALGSTKTRLHPVQERLANSHGSQCGYCSPGMVMSMYALLRNDPTPSKQDIERALEGNLCRCTGYRPILAGFNSFSKESACSMGDECCQKNCDNRELQTADVTGLDSSKEYLPYDPSQDPIFPPELQLSDAYDKQSLEFKGRHVTWLRPVSIEKALALKDKFPDAQFIGGGTAFGGLWKQIKKFNGNIRVIATAGIRELDYVKINPNNLMIGSGVTLTKLEKELSSLLCKLPAEQTQYLRAFVTLLNVYASSQIRNVATIGGAIASSGDLASILKVSGAKIKHASNKEGEKQRFILGLEVPFSSENEFCRTYKVADRHQFGTSYITATFKVKLSSQAGIVQDFSASISSYALPLVTVEATSAIGRSWNDTVINETGIHLREKIAEHWGDKEDNRLEYKVSLATSLLFKFYLSVSEERSAQAIANESCVYPGDVLSREPSCGTQVFEEVSGNQSKADAVGRPIVHLSSLQQVTGEAVYVDDMPEFKNELHMSLVTSTCAHAQILNLDMREAEAMAGVKACLSYKDVPASNKMGVIFPDEEVFATKKVYHQGQIIAAVVADTRENAARAAAAVRVEYNELKPIITIEDAIAENSFLEPVSSKTLTCGDISAGFAESDRIIEGEVMSGAQEHMALETLSAICVPTGEKSELTVYTNTQMPKGIQLAISEALGVAANKIVVKVKRIGGGFGGRQMTNASIALPAAVAAIKLNKPVRCVMSLEEEILNKGKQPSVFARYKIGVSKDGHFLALQVEAYFNCGHCNDMSLWIAGKFVWMMNTYKIPNVKVTARLCKTNRNSTTALRGFGGPQAIFIMESIVSHVFCELQTPREQLSFLNLYKDGDRTPYDAELVDCTVRRCFEECIQISHYHSRLEDVRRFNSINRWKKRGITLTPGMYPISFPKIANQAYALVHVYTDGSVMVSHGGVEMGQGLHTKIIQIASRVLDISVEAIHVMDTSTDRTPNCPLTAASMSTDLFGAAVKDACETLKKRIEPYKEADPNGSWKKWVFAAFSDQVSLSATGFYKIDSDQYDWETFRGTAYWYYTYGAACSEVEIDCLTGEHTILQTDIVMDVGKSLNPAIDIGQIEGAFVQGCGYLTMAEMRYSARGEVLTRGPNSYKIPGVQDIPVKMNVTLLKGSRNPKAVYSSKGIGEPSLLLATSVLCAIREAIMAARLEAGIHGHFRLDVPATPEKIRLLCPDILS